jgi:hypothetical protein
MAGRRVSTSGYNKTEYPPHYYDIARNFVSENIESSVLDIRTANSAIGVAVLALALSMHRRKSWNLALVILALAVPTATFFIASVNPTGLAISGVSAFTLAAVALTQRNQSLREVLAPSTVLIIASAMSFGSRRDAAAYCALIGALVLILDAASRLRTRNLLKDEAKRFILRPATLLISSLSIVLGLSFLNSGIGSVVTTGLDGDMEDRDGITVLFSNLTEIPKFFGGLFFGPGWGLGWLDTPLPLIVSLGASIATAVLFWPALNSSKRYERLAFFFLIACIAVLALVPLQADLRYVGETVQPRYLYPLFVASIMLTSSRSAASPRMPVVVLAGFLTVVANSVALRTNIRRYTTGLDVRSWRLDDQIEWWWSSGPSPSNTWLIGSLAFAGAFVLTALGRKLFDREVNRPIAEDA